MNISIRRATPDDANDIAYIHVVAWKATYVGIVPQSYLDSLDEAARTEMWRTELDKAEAHIYVAEDENGPCGFVCGGALRDPIDSFDAEIYAIYLLPSAKGQGTGRLLMQHIAEILQGSGLTQIAVWVLADNPSRGFYERLGGKVIAQKPIQIGGSDLLEVAYGWQDIHILIHSPHQA